MQDHRNRQEHAATMKRAVYSVSITPEMTSTEYHLVSIHSSNIKGFGTKTDSRTRFIPEEIQNAICEVKYNVL